jgi:hypothetical protein
MRIISLTSIPSRFDKLNFILNDLVKQNCDEIWLNIPKKYNRFPDWDGIIPTFNIPKVFVNVVDKDYGAGTKFIGSAIKLDPNDLIIYVDDDTKYSENMVDQLVSHFNTFPCAWGLSGFNFNEYFSNSIVRRHDYPVDIIEGYGGVIIKAGWVQNIKDYENLSEITCADDLIISSMLQKQGIERRTIHIKDFNLSHVRQYNFGFTNDALHTFLGGHFQHNKKFIEELQNRGLNYFSYKE